MREILIALSHNTVLMTASVGWFIAQFLKALLYAHLNRQFKFERLVGSGGMPSSHASTMMAAVMAAGWHYGLGSFPFAITALLALIVLHDARGVRLETGKQAEVLNKLMRHADLKELFQDEAYLKELVGHTPLQVAVGAVIGAVTGILMCLWVY